MTCAPLPSAPRHCCSRHALYLLVGSSAVCSPTPHKANPTAVPRGLEQCWNRDGTRRFCPVNKGVTECVTVLVWGGPILPVGAHSSAGHTVLAGPCHCRAPPTAHMGEERPLAGPLGLTGTPALCQAPCSPRVWEAQLCPEDQDSVPQWLLPELPLGRPGPYGWTGTMLRELQQADGRPGPAVSFLRSPRAPGLAASHILLPGRYTDARLARPSPSLPPLRVCKAEGRRGRAEPPGGGPTVFQRADPGGPGEGAWIAPHVLSARWRLRLVWRCSLQAMQPSGSLSTTAARWGVSGSLPCVSGELGPGGPRCPGVWGLGSGG